MAEHSRLLLLGSAEGVAAAIAAQLIDTPAWIACPADEAADMAMVDGLDDAVETPFVDVSDEALAAAVVDATLGRFAALQDALRRVAPGGTVVVIGSDAYLGRWYGAAQSAASAALVGMMRSVAMEHGRSGLRVNLLALPLDTAADDHDTIADAAVQVRALGDMRSMNGQILLVDRGENLRFAQSRRRGGVAQPGSTSAVAIRTASA